MPESALVGAPAHRQGVMSVSDLVSDVVDVWNDGRRHEARVRAHELVRQHPTELEPLLLHARLLAVDDESLSAAAAAERSSQALAGARAAWAADPEDPRGPRLVARAALLARDVPAALDAANQLVDLQPTSATGASALGLALLVGGKAGEAEAAFAAAKKADPDDYLAARGRVEVLVARGQVDKAVDALTAVIAHWPTYTEAVARRSQLGSPTERLRLARFAILLTASAFVAIGLTPEAFDVASFVALGVVSWVWTLPGPGLPHTRVWRHLSREDGDTSGPWAFAVVPVVSLALGVALGVLLGNVWDVAAPGAPWFVRIGTTWVALAVLDLIAVRARRPGTRRPVNELARLL